MTKTVVDPSNRHQKMTRREVVVVLVPVHLASSGVIVQPGTPGSTLQSFRSGFRVGLSFTLTQKP